MSVRTLAEYNLYPGTQGLAELTCCRVTGFEDRVSIQLKARHKSIVINKKHIELPQDQLAETCASGRGVAVLGHTNVQCENGKLVVSTQKPSVFIENNHQTLVLASEPESKMNMLVFALVLGVGLGAGLYLLCAK